MSQKDVIFQLPEAEEMSRRLRELNDDRHTDLYFHSLLLKHAGESFTALGLIMAYTLAIRDYVRSRELPSAVEINLEVAAHQYLRRLIDDGQALNQAMSYLGAMGLPND